MQELAGDIVHAQANEIAQMEKFQKRLFGSETRRIRRAEAARRMALPSPAGGVPEPGEGTGAARGGAPGPGQSG